MNYVNWIYVFSKRLLKKPLFLVLLCVFPCTALLLSHYASQERPLLEVALYNEGQSPFANDVIESLLKEKHVLNFYEVSSEAELIQDVQASRAECGYIFSKDYTAQHLLGEEDWKKSVRVIKSTTSVLTESIHELVFASVFQQYNQLLLNDYLTSSSLKEAVPDATEIYEEMMTNRRSIFYSTEGSFLSDKNSSPQDVMEQDILQEARYITYDFVLILYRGILGILILLGCLSGGILLIRDRKNVFLPLPVSRKRIILEWLDILTPALFLGISGTIGLMLLPMSPGLIHEAFFTLSIVLLSSIATYILSRLIRSEATWYSIIPFTILISLIILLLRLFEA